MSPIPEFQQRQIDRWCERCVPASKRGEYTVMSRWRGRMVTLVEKRTGRSDDGGSTERAFAQLRYGTDGLWTLYYWVDELGRWREYPATSPEYSPVPLLENIDRNADDGYFFARLGAR